MGQAVFSYGGNDACLCIDASDAIVFEFGNEQVAVLINSEIEWTDVCPSCWPSITAVTILAHTSNKLHQKLWSERSSRSVLSSAQAGTMAAAPVPF